MTPTGIPVNAPLRKGVYVWVAVLAALCSFAFLWGVFARVGLAGRPLQTSVLWRLVRTGVGAAFLLTAMQAFERWQAPAKAQARSAAISDKARTRFLALRSVLVTAGVAGYAIYFVLYLAGSYFPDIMILLAILIVAGIVIADICGRSFHPYRFVRPPLPLWISS